MTEHANNVSWKEDFGESPVVDVGSDTILAPFMQSAFISTSNSP